MLNIMWSRETLIVVLEENLILKRGPDLVKTKNLPKLSGLEELLSIEYKTFENSGLKYTPNEAQITAVEEICKIIKTSFEKTFLNEINNSDKEIFISEITKEVDVEQTKKYIGQISASVDNEFLDKFCETQMLAAYIKTKYDINKPS